MNGKVKLPELEQSKKLLKSLLNGINDNSKHFHKNIRNYNSYFYMASFGVKVMAKHFMPTFKSQGQIFHKAGFSQQ